MIDSERMLPASEEKYRQEGNKGARVDMQKPQRSRKCERRPRHDSFRQATHCSVGATGLRAGSSRSNASGTRAPSAGLSPGARAAGPGRQSPYRQEHRDSGRGCWKVGVALTSPGPPRGSQHPIRLHTAPSAKRCWRVQLAWLK